MWRDNELLMHLFEPEELEVLVCGGTDLDFGALQQAARYEDGFEETSEVCALPLVALKRLGDQLQARLNRPPTAGAGNCVRNPYNVLHALVLFIGLRFGLTGASSFSRS